MKRLTDVRDLPDKAYDAWFKRLRDDRYEKLLTDWSWWRRDDQQPPAGVPEAIRHGIVRMVQHLYEARGAKEVPPPPAAIAALWQPWRALRLGNRR